MTKGPFRASYIWVAVVLLGAGLAMPWFGLRPAMSAPAARSQDAAVRPGVEEMLSLFGQGKMDEMLQRMPIAPAGNRDEFVALRRQLVELASSAGKYTGFDIVGSQTLSDRYVQVYVLAYFEKEPVLFEFGFYRPATAWQVQKFKFRTDFNQFLETLPVQRS